MKDPFQHEEEVWAFSVDTVELRECLLTALLTYELPEPPVTLPPEYPGEDQRQQPRGQLDQPQQHQHHHLRARQVHH